MSRKLLLDLAEEFRVISLAASDELRALPTTGVTNDTLIKAGVLHGRSIAFMDAALVLLTRAQGLLPPPEIDPDIICNEHQGRHVRGSPACELAADKERTTP